MLALGLATLGGCQGDFTPTTANWLGDEVDVGTILAADSGQSLLDGLSTERTYRVLEGPMTGTMIAAQIESGEDEKTWHLVGRDMKRDVLLYEKHLQIGHDGNLVMSKMINHERQVISIFDPPIVEAVRSVFADEPFRQKLRMTIHPLDAPEKVREQGDVELTIELSGGNVINSGLGRLDALRLQRTFRAQLNAARVNRVTEQWLAPGYGYIAERYDERVTAFGLPIESSHELIVLESHRPAGDDS